MALPEEIIFTDPALRRALFDTRVFAAKPGHEAIVNIELFAISEMTVLFQKSRDLEHAEFLQRLIRAKWFLIRRHCDGYYIELPAGHDDGCEHVQAFAHEPGYFQVDRRTRAALWYRHKRKAPPRGL